MVMPCLNQIPRTNGTIKTLQKNWTPNVGQVVEEYVKSDIISELSRKITSIMNKEQKETLHNLINYQTRIIRLADKGSQIVILDIEDYRI